MKISKKLGVILLCICMVTSLFSINAYASSGSISISSASGTVGSTVTISCTVKCTSGPIGTADVVLTYNSSGLEYVSGTGGYSISGGAGSVSYHGLTQDGTSTSLSFTMQFKILKEGTYKIATSNVSAYGLDETYMSVGSASGTVTGKAVTTNNNDTTNNNTTNNNTTNNNTGTGNDNSSNNNQNDNDNTTTQPEETTKDTNSKLKSLKVSPGTLSPAFNASTTSYTVKVSEDTKEVTFSAIAQSEKAKVTVSGGKDLKLGENSAKIVVMAESGATTVYNLTIMCGEVEKIIISGETYTIDETFTDEQIPDGFVRTQITYNEREYKGLSYEKGDLQLISLKKEGSDTEYFIYDQAQQAFYPIASVKIAEGKTIIPLRVYETTAFSEMTTIFLNDKAFEAWKIDEEFSVIPALNMDGEEVLYKYDQVDGTLQRYSEGVPEEKEVVEPEEPTEAELILEKYGLYMIIGLSTLTVICLIVIICLIATRKSKHSARRRRHQKKARKQMKSNNEG